MRSGIYFGAFAPANCVVSVKFGGRIAVSHPKGSTCMTLAELRAKHEIGPYSSGLEAKPGSPVVMLDFDDVRSVDQVIAILRSVRTSLKNPAKG